MYYAPFTLRARLRLAHLYALQRINLLFPSAYPRLCRLQIYAEAFRLHFFSTRPMWRK